MLEKLNVDGIIVADGGIVDLLKEEAPSIPIHISTQANIVSYHTANFWHKNGAKRVILGRELNKKQIKEIVSNTPMGLETEIFIHGAICFGYSGRCFLSDFLAGRSANLGDCAQSCRWAYNLYAEEKNNPGNLMPVEDDDKGTYIFSSKDLCLIKEIPEIIDGIVEIKSVAREAGSRTKVAVWSNDENIDPVGSLVGKKGIRIQPIIDELGGEKIDVVPYSEDVPSFIINALSPAPILAIDINDEEKTATVVVPDEALSYAIGAGGQNVRLAAILTGWKIDIKTETMIKDVIVE